MEQGIDQPDAGEVTRLLRSLGDGSRTALDQLIPLLYPELRRLASAYLKRERRGHTLHTTDLVHEAYIRLVGPARIPSQSRAQFFGIAANLMRQILVNYAERRRAVKRGGGNKMTFGEAEALIGEPELDLLALDQALNKLARLDPRQSRIVELRFFGGLTEEEIADLEGVSARTVKREWRVAKLVLYHEMRDSGLL